MRVGVSVRDRVCAGVWHGSETQAALANVIVQYMSFFVSSQYSIAQRVA